MEDFNDLIPIINQLQLVFKKTGHPSAEIKLPQIVVVGAQSSGKSSVLESLVKKSFLPRGTGIVTRCPIILQLNQVQKTQNRSTSSTPNHEKFKPNPGPEEWCRFSKNPEKIYTDFDEVREEIEDLQKKIAGDKKGISIEPIILEVFSPNVIDLTLVDLPGIVKLALDGQPADIEEQVYRLISHYIQTESAIILAVSPANADIATSESIKFAKNVDPEGNRTIAVVTKLDLMDKGTDAASVLSGEAIKVKLGIVGVVNRSQEDINNNTSMEEVRQKEEAILRKTYPQIHGIGSQFLATRLNQVLKKHIYENLPALIKRISTLTGKYEAELNSMGPEIASNPTDCSWLIMETTLKFVAKFEETVRRRPVEVTDPNDLFAGHATDAFKRLREGIIIDRQDIGTLHIWKSLQDTLNFEGFSSIEQVFRTIVMQGIHKMEAPAVACAQEIFELLLKTASKSFTDDRLTCLNHILKGVVEELLTEQLKQAKIGIKEYIELQAGMMVSSDKDFVRCLVEGPEKMCTCCTCYEAGDTQNQMEPIQDNSVTTFPLSTEYSVGHQNDLKILHIQQLIINYLLVVRREMSDYVPKYLMYQLVRKTLEKIPEATKFATSGKETTLLAEPLETRVKRKHTQDLLNNLREAMQILRQINVGC